MQKKPISGKLKDVFCFVSIVSLIFFYGWTAAPFLEEYKGIELGHMWLSGDQIWKVQGLFLIAILMGALIALCSWSREKHERRAWKLLKLVSSLLIMELPYIGVGVMDLVYPAEFHKGLHPIYNHLPEAIMQRIGFGDFIVSTLAAVWAGILITALLRERRI